MEFIRMYKHIYVKLGHDVLLFQKTSIKYSINIV